MWNKSKSVGLERSFYAKQCDSEENVGRIVLEGNCLLVDHTDHMNA